MTTNRKAKIRTLLKGIETGDPGSVAVVNEEKYIQHNPETHEGSIGLAALFKEIAKTSPRVNIVRIFEDGDYVFGHTECDFARSNIGFEVFRFEADQVVEHWDNIQQRLGPNPSGHSMVDGETEVTDLHLTEANRETVRTVVETVLINRQPEKLERFMDDDNFVQHNPHMADGIAPLCDILEARSEHGYEIQYNRLHHLLTEGNFVLAVSEGLRSGVHSSFYDLFRLTGGKLVEHWDTIEAIPPRSKWKNANGKF